MWPGHVPSTITPCVVPTVYPAGAALYTSTYTAPVDIYYIRDNSPAVGSGYYLDVLTDGAGVALTSIPAIGTRFCFNGKVYDPIPGVPSGTDNYNWYYGAWPPSCSSTDIASALATAADGTALVSLKPTGNSVVPNVMWVQQNTPYSYDFIFAFHLGRVMQGSILSAGFTDTWQYHNKTAANAALVAAGLPLLP